EASLGRLQTDYIDLYQAHWDDLETPLPETLRAFDDLGRQGKVRYIGASNYPAWRLTRALWESDRHHYVRYECLQPKYNLVIRDEYERELEPLCREQEVGVIPYFSLASGFLSGKYRSGEPLPKTARAGGVEKTYMNERGFRVLAAVGKVAAAGNANAGRGAGVRVPGSGRDGGGGRQRGRRAGVAVVARAPAGHHRADRERNLRCSV